MRVVTTYVDKPMVGYWISLQKWNTSCGKYLTRERVYYRGKWTPFVKLRKRYD